MKKIIICCALVSILQTTARSLDFQRRFGPDSAIYNQPLYFSQREPKKRDRRPRRSFREQIRTRMHKNETRHSTHSRHARPHQREVTVSEDSI